MKLPRVPRLHPALGGLLMGAFLFSFLIVFDLLVLGEPFASVWQGALFTAVVVSAFQAMFVASGRRRRAEAGEPNER
ncbi:MAG: hypothetical protein ABI571_05550 [Actinomycetota bacterium]